MKTSRRVKPITPERLGNIALHYLSRFAASEASLRRVLENRLRRTAMRDPAFAADAEKQKQLRLVIETIIEKHRKTGVLNDAAYAEMKINSLRRAGRSRRAIEQKLSQKGIKTSLIKQVITKNDDDPDSEEAEIKAAKILARRKRLGPFRAGATDPDRHRKDMAALARAGFSLDVVRKVLGGEVEEE